MFIVPVKDPDPAAGKELRLAGQIVGKIRMFVWADMVRGKIRIDAVIEVDAVRAVVLDAGGGDLHHHVFAALFQHIGGIALDIVRFRRGVFSRKVLVQHSDAVGPDHARLFPGGLQDRHQHVRGGGLALGPGHADDRELLRRIAEPRGREQRQRFPPVSGFHHRNVCVAQDPARHGREFAPVLLNDHGRRALLGNLRKEVVGIGPEAVDRDEQAAGTGFAGIVYDAGDIDIAAAADQGVRGSFE